MGTVLFLGYSVTRRLLTPPTQEAIITEGGSDVNKDEKLVRDLIDAAYDSGYESGRKQDGQPLHLAAIERRNKVKRDLLKRLAQRRRYLPGGG